MIELQYFEGCPNAKATLGNLQEIQRELAIPDVEIIVVEVPDIDSAEKNRFRGSPTILVDGIDLYTETEPVGHNFSCRVYSFDGKQTGVIPRDFMKDKILKFRSD
jgi:hypothetical protein